MSARLRLPFSLTVLGMLMFSICVGCPAASLTEAGYAVDGQEQAIVRGQPVMPGEYPWMVYANGCSASLISSSFVLMSAHCFAQNRNADGTLEGVEIDSLPLLHGDPNLDSEQMTSHPVAEVHMHPDYLPLTVEETYGLEPYDVALVELSSPILAEQYLRLPTRDPIADEEIIAAGWGITESGQQPRNAQQARLIVADDTACFVGDEIRFCTLGNADNSNIASGDSGGPVFVPDGDGFMVLGTNSASNGDAPDPLGLHARIIAFVPWILSIAGDEFACTGEGADQICEADVDECALGLDACGAHGRCENTVGSYTCVCDTGYTSDGQTCVDIDECADDPGCTAQETCVDFEGGFECIPVEGDGSGCRAEIASRNDPSERLFWCLSPLIALALRRRLM